MIHYWIAKNKSLGRDIKFGDEIKDIDKDRAKELIGKGFVSTKKPETFTASQNNALDEIKAQNIELKKENSELKTQLDEATDPKKGK